MSDLLTPTHRTMLEKDSAIAPDVIAERGYRSLTSAEAATVLPTLRFSVVQSRLGSGLLFPLTLPDDPAPLYQFRPDHPRRDDEGKPIKYELPARTTQRLIVHPRAMAALRSGTTAVYVTEGAKKYDSLLSRGATPLGGIGVWSFTVPRTRAEKKRGTPKVLLPDWQSIALQGRQIIIVFDSDAALNADIDEAEQQLAALLRDQGATVNRVRLPAASDGTKQGIDDFFARGHSLADVEALIQPVPRLRFATISAEALYHKAMPPIVWVIPGKLPAGATLFVGRGKDGKSLLVWNLAMSVVTGGKALGAYDVQQGDVLYLALEDGERRARQRLFDQMDHMGMNAPPPRLDLVPWTAPRIGEGFMERMETWVDEHPEGRLIIVDILEKVRPARTKDGIYADDYRALEAMQQFGQRRNIAVLVVHHSNKTNPEDFRDSASGSTGLIGACDTFWRLRRNADAPEATLKMLGREVEKQDLAMQFQDGFWSVLGDSATVYMSPERQAILKVLGERGGALSPLQIATALDRPLNHTKQLLRKLLMAGLVIQPTYGLYALPSYTPPDNSSNSHNCDNSDNSDNSVHNPQEKQGVSEDNPSHAPDEELSKSYREDEELSGPSTADNSFQPLDNADSYGPKMPELSELSHISTHAHMPEATDCLPEATIDGCAHPETTRETMEDGSLLVRCLTCRWRQVILHP
jgi:RecA-family ATPase